MEQRMKHWKWKFLTGLDVLLVPLPVGDIENRELRDWVTFDGLDDYVVTTSNGHGWFTKKTKEETK